MGGETRSNSTQRYRINSGAAQRPSSHSTAPEYSAISSSAAGGATYKDDAGIVINQDKTGISSTFVNDTFTNTVKETIINPSKAQVYADNVWSREQAVKKSGLVRTAGKMITSEIEAQKTSESDLTGRTRIVATRYAFKSGRYAALGGFTVIRGAGRYGRFASKLANDKKNNILDGKEARTVMLNTVRGSMAESGKSIKKIIQNEAIKGIEDFRGSDDLGMQAITKPKDVVVQTRRALKVATKTGSAIKKSAHSTAKATKKMAQKSGEAAKAVGKFVKKLFSKPLFIKAALSVGTIVVIVSIVVAISSSISAIIPTVSIKSEDRELTRTYEHITKLDAELTEEIRGIKTSAENVDVDEFHFYVNGFETVAENITIYTNADAILLYLDCLYDDYAFDKAINSFFGGTTIEEEIALLHSTLYYYTVNKYEEEIIHLDTFVDPDTGRPTFLSWTETKMRMDIHVSMTGFEEYLSIHRDEMLTEEQQERMDILLDIGMYTARVQLGSPFIDQDYFISTRWGWQINPITGALENHLGVDIPKPYNTPINNVMYGTVSAVSYDAIYGNYVVVGNGERVVLYAHLSRAAVTIGQTVGKGDIIGYVGSSGTGTGNDLHLEYTIENGLNTNPAFYLEGAIFAAAGVGSDDIVQVAASQIGNIGGQKYWSWYGFSSRVEWCAAFVSWCANECGYITSGTIPKFSSCAVGIQWFRSRGLWQSGGGGYVPKAGDIIFFDWEVNGQADHVGIVEWCDGNTVYTIEGNSGNVCRRRTYSLYSSVIFGYGTPAY